MAARPPSWHAVPSRSMYGRGGTSLGGGMGSVPKNIVQFEAPASHFG